MKNTIFLSIFLLITSLSFAQGEDFLAIQKAWKKVLNTESESEKLRLHNSVLGLIGNHLNHKKKSDLNSLENFKDLWSKDSSLRVVTWFYQLNKNDFEIHGHINYDGDRQIAKNINYLHSVSLQNNDLKIKRDTSYSAHDWPAAWYYKLIEKEDKFGKTHYTLIGWIPKNRISQQKVVDILWFDEEDVYFGAPLFERDGQREYRLLYEYGAQNTMRLSYQEEQDRIIMDHLSPPGAEYHGIYEFYGPDFSFDAFRWENDRWLYYPDVDVDAGLQKKKSEFQKKDLILEETPVYSPKGD